MSWPVRAGTWLSIVAVIFLPLSFFTVQQGINIGGIPGADSALGCTFAVDITGLVAVGLLMYIRW